MITIITKELVDRINILARKQKSEGLTPKEQEEQHQLRQQYLKGIRGQVEDALSKIKYVEDEPCGCGTNSCGCGDHTHHHHHEHKKGSCGCSDHKHKKDSH